MRVLTYWIGARFSYEDALRRTITVEDDVDTSSEEQRFDTGLLDDHRFLLRERR